MRLEELLSVEILHVNKIAIVVCSKGQEVEFT